MKSTSGNNLRRALYASVAVAAVAAAGTAIAAAPPAIPGGPAGGSVSETGAAGGAFGSEATPSVSSTINVSGAQTYIRDVDVRVLVPHTWSSDIDLTLSHGGVTIPLTTDNPDDLGGGTPWAGAFANTLFDDDGVDTVSSENPSAGVYIAAVPEGAMGRFIGMNPNGDWTLTATDDEILDEPGVVDPDVPTAFFTGSLDGWTLDIQTLAGPPTVQATAHVQSTSAPIGDQSTRISQLNVTGAQRYLTDVDLTTTISHLFPGDLEIKVTSPGGTTAWLSNNRGGESAGALAGAVFNDQASTAIANIADSAVPPAGSYMPEGAMSAFIGENPNGVWTLSVADNDNPTGQEVGGTLVNWRLDIDSTGGAPPAPPTPQAAPPTQQANFVCKDIPARRTSTKTGRVLRNGQGMKIQQNQISAAILRLNALNARMRGGFQSRDLCGHAFGPEDFAAGISWAGGGSTASASVPSPRAISFPKLKTKGATFPFSQRQAGINDTLANFVLAKAIATRKRARALKGGDLQDNALTQVKLTKGLKVTNIAGTDANAKSSLGKVNFKRVQKRPLTNTSLLATQRKSQQAIRIINQITDEMRAGLTGQNFADGSIGASRLAPDVTAP